MSDELKAHCVFCGWAVNMAEEGWRDKAREHMITCPEDPRTKRVQDGEARIKELEARIEELVGYSGMESA